jgi:hypothetical protein
MLTGLDDVDWSDPEVADWLRGLAGDDDEPADMPQTVLFNSELGADAVAATPFLLDVAVGAQERLKAYMAFAATLKEAIHVSFRMTTGNRPGSRSQPLDREDGLERLSAARLRRTTDWEALLLLADEAVVAAGRQWREAVVRVERMARATDWDGTGWDDAVEAANVARDAFYTAARASLGVRGGPVSQADILRQERSIQT